jgi:hypothetical protein
LDEQIERVAISVVDKPVWFTEKLYPVGKVSKILNLHFIASGCSTTKKFEVISNFQ